MRLHPIELDRGNGTDVEPVDVHGIGQGPLERDVLRDARANQRRADFLDHLVLRALDDRHEREHVLLFGDRGPRALAMNDDRTQVVAALH